ncbi:MAG: phospho-N-acetylmuramoyl-pentapeptide-transferase, partial [Clostridia bacterium]|nr:phospho-N-acetylmuramoyl-pentapeptide-transferase [Clostridia bacterium]
MLFNLIPEKLSYLGIILLPVIVCTALLALFKNKLPKDQGRDFAFNGKLSAGKIRGAGIIFVIAFIIVSLLVLPLPLKMNLEYYFYLILVFFGMLSGYLDDAAEKPWGEYKKGIIDLVISALTAANFVFFNPDSLNISFFGMNLNIHPVIFGIIAAVLVWMLINATNCSDGIDGFCGSLTIVSLVSIMIANKFLAVEDERINWLIIILIGTLIPYLWFNSEPSTMMMGDAGSRALGLFLCICILKTG